MKNVTQISLQSLATSAKAGNVITPNKLPTILALLPILITLGIGMWYSFPVWDDAWLHMLIKEHGLGAVRAAIPDRPLAAVLIYGILHLTPLPVVILSLVLWVILGGLAARLQAILFPSLEGYRPLCIILTVSPVLAKPHFVIFNAMPTALLAVIFAYLGLVTLHFYVTAEMRTRFLPPLGILFFAVGILISEYAMPCALILLIMLIPYARDERSSRRAIRAIVLLLIVMVMTYSFAALHARPNTSPLFPLQQFKSMAISFPFTLAGAIWQALIGAYTENLGYLSQLSLLHKPRLLCMALGIMTSIPLLAACHKSKSPSIKSIFIPLTALIVGVLPICLMYRVPYPNIETRYFLPTAPLASVLFVFLLAKAFHHNYWIVPVILVGLMAGSATGFLTITGIEKQRAADRYSEALKQEVANSKNLVIALLPIDAVDFEITGKVTRNWPPELEKRFWAYSEPFAASFVGPRDKCRIELFNRSVRLVQRMAPVDKVLTINEAGLLEPYCQNK